MSCSKGLKTGIDFSNNSVHISRTFMIDELTKVFENVASDAQKDDYKKSILDDNCLGKRSLQNRKSTYTKLSSLYTFDPRMLIFKALRYYWSRDVQSKPLLALLCSSARDAFFRDSIEYIVNCKPGMS